MFEFIHGLCPHFSKTSGVSTILDNFHKQDGELIYQTHAFIKIFELLKIYTLALIQISFYKMLKLEVQI